MRYQLTPIYCRPWLLNGLSVNLIESHYENNYGGALRRLNAITEKLESVDFENDLGRRILRRIVLEIASHWVGPSLHIARLPVRGVHSVAET